VGTALWIRSEQCLNSLNSATTSARASRAGVPETSGVPEWVYPLSRAQPSRSFKGGLSCSCSLARGTAGSWFGGLGGVKLRGGLTPLRGPCVWSVVVVGFAGRMQDALAG
jgi:hypothetical protein